MLVKEVTTVLLDITKETDMIEHFKNDPEYIFVEQDHNYVIYEKRVEKDFLK